MQIHDEYTREMKEARDLLAERAQKFREQNADDINRIQQIINRNIYLSLELGEPRYIGQQKYHSDSLQLIDRAIRLNITAFDLVNEGKTFEASILYRSIIEFCAVSIAINKNDEEREKFKNDLEFSSTRVMKIANKFIPGISRMWGELSEMVVHTNPSHGTKKYRDHHGEIKMLQYFITSLYRDPDSDDTLVLNQLYLMGYLILHTIEIVCFVEMEFDSEKLLFYTDKKRRYQGESGAINFRKYHNLVYSHPKQPDEF